MSKHALIIGSYVGSPWLSGCVATLPRDIPTIVVFNDSYECGKIAWTYHNTTLDEFFFLPDTIELKQHQWLRDCFSAVGESISLNQEPGKFGSFCGKYRRETLKKVAIPHTPDKWSAVHAEMSFTRAYCEAEGEDIRVLFPDFRCGGNPVTVEKNGRPNAVLENEHLRKYKGAWDGISAGKCEERDRILSGRAG